MQEAAVGVEERSEASYECCADLIGSEGHWANQCDAKKALMMGDDFTA
jgi:hypothetical protein